MKIILPHNKKSEKVKELKEIVADANEMRKMLLEEGFLNNLAGYAIHHSQVSENPKDFFVVNPKVRALFYGHIIIANPKIVSVADRRIHKEKCLSYPFRPEKNIRRYYKIEINCDVENETGDGLYNINMQLEALAAYVVQHEMDHALGRFIHDKDRR